MDRDAHIYCWWYEVCDGRAVVACKQENDRFLYALGTTSKPVIFRRRLHQLIGRNGCCAASS
uniref:Uncharacterized protein n=2 Tax=Pseudomonas aeruginosa TaxID=287 RepID=A0A2L1KGY9_PSEAI|nr:Tn21 protein of unknown function Urf2 [Pseudomonas aeruginosa]